MRCQDTYLYVRSWIYEQSLICYFLNIVLACCLLVIGRTEGTTGARGAVWARYMQGVTEGENFKKSARSTTGKIFFARFF